jgi:hypothetical protein
LPIEDAKELSPLREIIAATGDVIKLQREEFHFVAAACCVPSIVIILVWGLVNGQPYAALAATAGAFSVGFGLFQRLSSFATAPMLLALVGMTISATVDAVAKAEDGVVGGCDRLFLVLDGGRPQQRARRPPRQRRVFPWSRRSALWADNRLRCCLQ